MKNSDSFNHINLQLSSVNLKNRNLSQTDSTMAVSNSNTNSVVIGSVIPASLHPSSSHLTSNRLLNMSDVKNCNLTILTKGQTIPNSNIVNPLNLTQNNNTIKLVNLSKQQFNNINKDQTNMISSNTINVQFLTPNTNSISVSAIGDSGHYGKSDGIQHSVVSASTTPTSSNIPQSPSTSSIPCTRLIFQNQQCVPHGSVTLVPQQQDYNNSGPTNNQLIKNTNYVFKNKQAIRPIITQGLTKQQINIKSPAKPLTNLSQLTSISMAENINNQESINSRSSLHIEEQKSLKTPVKIPLQYSVTNSNNNIRLALTTNMNNPKVHNKIQVISPKSRKRSASPINLFQDSKQKEQSVCIKDDSSTTSNFNLEPGNYSPTRKRARKQHLKSVISKSQKSTISSKLINRNIDAANTYNSIRPAVNDKVTNTISITPKVTNISVQNKSEDSPTPTVPIILELKNPIQLCQNSRNNSNPIIQRPNSILSSNQANSSSTTISNPTLQIITQTANPRQIQLSPGNTNLILSPKSAAKTPQKIIISHTSCPTNNVNSRLCGFKNEKIPLEHIFEATDFPNKPEKANSEKPDYFKSEPLETKSEASDDASSLKFSLFPYKYSWNPRKNHFEKKSDVKFRKVRTHHKSSSNYLASSSYDKDLSNSDTEISDTSWYLYKASHQILLQKKFDTENMQKFCDLKSKFEKSNTEYELKDPVFDQLCTEANKVDTFTEHASPSLSIHQSYTDPSMFGIADDIIQCNINTLPKSPTCQSPKCPSSRLHKCSSSCTYVYTEIFTSPYSPQTSKILDLLEGLIVKERTLIEKESEIYEHCQKLLHSSNEYSTPNDSKYEQDYLNSNCKLLNGKRR